MNLITNAVGNFKIGKTLVWLVVAGIISLSIVVFKTYANPDTVITPAGNGDNVSIDLTSAAGGSGTYSALTGLTITEGAPGEITTGDHILTLPAGWEFDTTADGVGITVVSGDIGVSATTLTPTSNTLTFSIDTTSSSSPAELVFTGLWVRPTGSTLSSGNILHSGAAITGVTDATTSFGQLSTVAGAASQIGFGGQPYGTVVVGIALTEHPVVVSQDQFGNTRSDDTNTVTLSAFSDVGCSTPATGTLGGTLTEVEIAGVADFNGNGINYDTAETIYLNASDGTYNVCSNAITVTADPDIALVAADKTALTADSIKGNNADLDNVSVGLTNPLPSSGSNGSTITWESDTPGTVSNDGQTVNRPSFSAGNATVTMTATITKGVVSDTKDFVLTVLAEAGSTDATITSSSFTVSTGGTPNETVTAIPYGTSKAEFLAGITKNNSQQTWDTSGINDPVTTGDSLSVTAEDGVTEVTYTLTVDAASPTPTVAPTIAPAANNNPPTYEIRHEAPRCNAATPLTAPDLFKIITSKGSAKLIYTPISGNATGYMVMYGLKKGDERYAANIPLVNNNQGEQNFTVNKLNPKTTYYFKVAAVNDCTAGPWSEWIPAKADSKRTVDKYKTVVKNKVKTLENRFK